MKGAKAAARMQAKAIEESSQAQQKQARLQAQAAQQQQESMIGRDKALRAAQSLTENQKVQDVEVDTSSELDTSNLDELGRRRAPREAYKIRSRSIRV